MEDRTDNPMAVKVERHSHYVVLTYFHGDTDSMVDAHFARALSSNKAPAAKAKKIRKTVKLGESEKSCVTRGNSLLPVLTVSVPAPSREEQLLPGEYGRRLPSVKGPSAGRPPEPEPGGWRARPVALLHHQGRRRARLALHHILAVPGGIEPHRAAIRLIPAQPPSHWPGRGGAQRGLRLEAGAASQLDDAARIQRASGPGSGVWIWWAFSCHGTSLEVPHEYAYT